MLNNTTAQHLNEFSVSDEIIKYLEAECDIADQLFSASIGYAGENATITLYIGEENNFIITILPGHKMQLLLELEADGGDGTQWTTKLVVEQ